MEKKFLTSLVILGTILLGIEGCGDSQSIPSAPESQVEFVEVFTDTDGEGIFTVGGDELRFKTIDEATGEAIKNVESYLVTDGAKAVVLLVDPLGDYIPRLASDETEVDKPSYSQPAPSRPQFIWSGTKEFTLHLWSTYVKGGSHLVYEDEDPLPEGLTWELLHKHYKFWRTTTLDKLEITLSDIVEMVADQGGDLVVTTLLSFVPYVGPALGGGYKSVTLVYSYKDILVEASYQSYFDQYRLAGYKPDQEFEIWKMKITNPRFASPILVIPLESPGSAPVDTTPPETFITDAPDEVIDYNRIISPRLRAWGPTAHIMIY